MQQKVPDRVYLTPSDLGVRQRVSTKTLAHWRARGVGPRWAKFSGRVRYALDDVETWEADQYANAGGAA